MTRPTAHFIDLNADVGELPARLTDGREAALIRQLSSANLACGGHAGDLDSMRAVVALCRDAHVAVGAHPSFPDREHFGRRRLDIEPSALAAALRQQVQALSQVAREQGLSLSHIKPHGALYHAAADDPQIARVLVQVVHDLGESPWVVGRAGSRGLDVCRQAGLRVLEEGFADRRYASAGALVDRSIRGAVLHDVQDVVAQALGLALHGQVQGADGQPIVFLRPIDTLCLHSDTAGAEQLGAQLRDALQQAGIEIAAPARRGR